MSGTSGESDCRHNFDLDMRRRGVDLVLIIIEEETQRETAVKAGATKKKTMLTPPFNHVREQIGLVFLSS